MLENQGPSSPENLDVEMQEAQEGQIVSQNGPNAQEAQNSIASTSAAADNMDSIPMPSVIQQQVSNQSPFFRSISVVFGVKRLTYG